MPSPDPTLPSHASLVSGPHVWMEAAGVEQLARVAALTDCLRAVGMPDLHPGRGFPIGAIVATRDIVYPHLIGGDAGCGARLVATSIERTSPDRLERRLRAAFEESPFGDANPAHALERAWHLGARGLADVEGLPDGLRNLAAQTPFDDLPPSGDLDRLGVGFESALGTIGGGNHFAEVSRVCEVTNERAAKALGLTKNALVALVHSGSRGLGSALSRAWGTSALARADIPRYLADLAGACRFAGANRLVLAYRVLSALGALRERDRTGGFDVCHNDVQRERLTGDLAWVHRKGAAPAYDNVPTVVLGSRGSLSWVMLGTGSESGLRSVAHGAGRRMGRSEAKDKLRARYRRDEVQRFAGKGRVICDDKDLLFEEHPDAYKPIEPVIDALEAHALAVRVAALMPVITVKL